MNFFYFCIEFNVLCLNGNILRQETSKDTTDYLAVSSLNMSILTFQAGFIQIYMYAKIHGGRYYDCIMILVMTIYWITYSSKWESYLPHDDLKLHSRFSTNNQHDRLELLLSLHSQHADNIHYNNQELHKCFIITKLCLLWISGCPLSSSSSELSLNLRRSSTSPRKHI